MKKPAVLFLILFLFLFGACASNQEGNKIPDSAMEPTETRVTSQVAASAVTQTLLPTPTDKPISAYGNFFFWHRQGYDWGISKYSIEDDKLTFVVEDVFLNDCHLDITSDGKYLVYSKNVRGESGITEVYVLDLGTQFLRNVSNNPNDHNYSPSISDNGLVAFASSKFGKMDLYVYDLNADSLERLTNNDFIEYDPVISKDGTKIAYIQTYTSENYLVVMDVDLKSVILSLKIGEDTGKNSLGDLRFSPENQYVAFSENKGTGEPAALYIVTLDSQEIVSLSNEFELSNFTIAGLSWSPDGRSLAISTEQGTTYTRLFVYELDSGTLTEIYEILGLGFPPQWSSDGQWVAVPGLGLSTSALVLIDPGGESEPITVYEEEGRFNFCGLEWVQSSP